MPIRIARTVVGGSVEPRALLSGLAAAAVSAGATICERAPVRRVSFGPRPTLELDGRTVIPRHIIVALNAWTAALVPKLPRLQSALTFACATEPLDEAVIEEIGLHSRIPFYTADTPYLWGRMTADNRVVFGAGLVFGKPDDLENCDIAGNSAADVITRLQTRVHRLHPALARIRIPWQWAGPIAFTEDAIPILARHPDHNDVLVAGAYAGHGVAFSVYAGEQIARAICEGAVLPEWGALRR